MNEFHLKKLTFKEFLSVRRNIDPLKDLEEVSDDCLLYTSPSPRDEL